LSYYLGVEKGPAVQRSMRKLYWLANPFKVGSGGWAKGLTLFPICLR
jgi:hypothetical protein